MGTGVQLQLPLPSSWKSRSTDGRFIPDQRCRRPERIFRLGKWRAPPSLLLFGEQNGSVISRQCCGLPGAVKSEEQGGVEKSHSPFRGKGEELPILKTGVGKKCGCVQCNT